MSRVIGEESGKKEREWRRVENEQEEGQFLRTRWRRRGMSRQEGGRYCSKTVVDREIDCCLLG